MGMGLPIVYFKVSQVEFFLNYDGFFLSLKVVLILPNSADTDEMQHSGSSIFAKVPVQRFSVYKWLTNKIKLITVKPVYNGHSKIDKQKSKRQMVA